MEFSLKCSFFCHKYCKLQANVTTRWCSLSLASSYSFQDHFNISANLKCICFWECVRLSAEHQTPMTTYIYIYMNTDRFCDTNNKKCYLSVHLTQYTVRLVGFRKINYSCVFIVSWCVLDVVFVCITCFGTVGSQWWINWLLHLFLKIHHLLTSPM